NVGIAALIIFACYLAYIIYDVLGLYQINPFIRLKPLSVEEQQLIADHIPIYGRLPEKYRQKCNSRIIWFRSKKKFVFYGEIEEQEELILILSAAVVLMTLGLRNYEMLRSLLRVVVYPTIYYSKLKRRHHLGEYNPNLKTLVLSADKIWEGFEIPDDNRNLAVHEFAHALSFEMLKKNSWEAKRFRVGIRQIGKLFQKEAFRTKLVSSQYFREYGMTDLQEFFSVAVENYFETPSIFHNDFPELFDIIQRMLNFDYEISCMFNPPKKLP
ncbi:MAG: zinc-dependent peptidase, partial [Aurantibacter sp.]